MKTISELLKEAEDREHDQEPTQDDINSALETLRPFVSQPLPVEDLSSVRFSPVYLSMADQQPPSIPQLPPRITSVEKPKQPRKPDNQLLPSYSEKMAVFNYDWLFENVTKHIQKTATSEFVSPESLVSNILTILNSSKQDDIIQNELVELLGFDNFEFLTELLTHRQEIRRITEEQTTQQAELEPRSNSRQELAAKSEQLRAQIENLSISKTPQYGAQVTIQTESQKQELKEKRKLEKKMRKALNQLENEQSDFSEDDLMDGTELRAIHQNTLETNSQRPQFSSPFPSKPELKYPHVYMSNSSGYVHQKMMSIYGTPFTLPSETVRRDTKEFEEVTMPIGEPAKRPPSERVITINDMDEWVRPVFKGYKQLNRIQSIVYPTAYYTNENMLVCAPTGAGKTDVAMLTVLAILRQFRQSVSDDEFELLLNDFKIVYVAPMKALASEVVKKFSSRLECFGVQVRELTGDMSLTKAEIVATQMIVTTPEKWDVVTRKANGDVELVQKVRLLIIDEVHLLHDDRGAVLESLVARTLRFVESSQSMIRIVGLSATLPNYVDVAEFLRVNFQKGLFFFDGGFRPVPLGQTFIGVKGGKAHTRVVKDRMNRVTFEKIVQVLEEGRQAIIFVQSRKETVNAAFAMRDLAQEQNLLSQFEPSDELKASALYMQLQREVEKSRNNELRQLFKLGLGIHNSGMLRSDRNLTEKLFEKGLLRVLVSTNSLAWGVNTPAFAVVIKGTQIYDASKGGFIDMSILDVLQIFGRAGRPQFEPYGLGYIVTTHDKLVHYISHMASQLPIESRFAEHLVDNLNAEISATGTVTNLDEAVQWLGYTYLYIRMRKNPQAYGLQTWDPTVDPYLGQYRRELCVVAARQLSKAQMIVFDESNGFLIPKDLGRVAAGYYIRKESVDVFNESLHPRCAEADVLGVISCSQEFDGLKARDDEVAALKKLVQNGACPCEYKTGPETDHGKINILIQAYISRMQPEEFSLISDMNYIAQNTPRVLRALFEVTLKRKWGPVSNVVLSLCKSVEKRMWSFEHPLAQFTAYIFNLSAAKKNSSTSGFLPPDIIRKLEDSPSAASNIEALREMSSQDLGHLVRHVRMGDLIYKCLRFFPTMTIDVRILPITRTVIRLEVVLSADFDWSMRFHGAVEPWWIWVEDADSTEIYHSEYFLLQRQQVNEIHRLGFIVPVSDPLPSQLFVRVISDKWIGAETIHAVDFRHVVLPETISPHTDLLDIRPLPVSTLQNELYEDYMVQKFQHFNPVQSQVFHSLYHTDYNMLIGAPTGSGKTVCAELAILRLFTTKPNAKCVYIAPLKALVRERIRDWQQRLGPSLGKRVVELTGDVTPDMESLQHSDIIITTPEKWDGISRHWQQRSYVKDVSLVVIDEIHLLGGDRGPILEVIVSRMNYISFHCNTPTRIVGLSTALANSRDLALWLNVHPTAGLFNFRHSVRPVPLEIYIDGFAGKHYCPRMATMNKPVFKSILMHSPDQPVLIFVSSRRQTRLTAKDLIALCANSYTTTMQPKRFLRMPEEEIQHICETQVKDANLKDTLSFGIGLHHAGLAESDRRICEELFLHQKIQILIATSTLAWGINTGAHLVVIKGTEFYDAKSKQYVDFPITDVLQMMGRAGRPGYDTTGIAHIMVHDEKKSFYKKFLHEPFPVESSLHESRHLNDHLNAEIVAGTIKTKQDAVDYLTWTFFYRRLRMNPTYYGLIPAKLHDELDEDEIMEIKNKSGNRQPGSFGHQHVTDQDMSEHLSRLVEDTFYDLEQSGCLEIEDDTVTPTILANIASYYYLKHTTIRFFKTMLAPAMEFDALLGLMCFANEYDEFPIRHNEDKHNEIFAKELRLSSKSKEDYSSPHVKVYMLLQAHFSRMKASQLPVADYVTDMRSALDQSIRILQALIDISASYTARDNFTTTLNCITLLQCLKRGAWWDDNTFSANGISTLSNGIVKGPKGEVFSHLPELISDLSMKAKSKLTPDSKLSAISSTYFPASQRSLSSRILLHLPSIFVSVRLFSVNNPNGILIPMNGSISLPPDTDVKLSISFTHTRYAAFEDPDRDGLVQAYTPNFPKAQYESWILSLGDTKKDELMALKRLGSIFLESERKKRQSGAKGVIQVDVTSTISWKTPELDVNLDMRELDMRLVLMSDCYIGLDQVVDFKCIIVREE